MGYTIAIFRKKELDGMLGCDDFADRLNSRFPIDVASDDRSCLISPLDKVYSGLAGRFPPLNGPEACPDEMVDDAADYSFLENAFFVSIPYGQAESFMWTFAPLAARYRCAWYEYDTASCHWIPAWSPLSPLRMGLTAFRDSAIVFLILSGLFFVFRWYSGVADEALLLIDFRSVRPGWWIAGSAAVSFALFLLVFFVNLYRMHRK